MTEWCTGNCIQMLMQLYSDEPHGNGECEAAICLWRIMFIHLCSDQTYNSVGGNVEPFLLIELCGVKCNTHC
jgi:hypothetical protein